MPPLTAEFEARLWQFVATALGEDDTEDCPDAWLFASWLAGAWAGATARLHMEVGGLSRDEAYAAVGELVAAQIAICGSLAASEAGQDRRAPRQP